MTISDGRFEEVIGVDRLIQQETGNNVATVNLDLGRPNQGTWWLIERIAVTLALGATPTGNERILVFAGNGDSVTAIDVRDFTPVVAPYFDPADRGRVVSDISSPIRVWDNEAVILRAAGLPIGSGIENIITASIQITITQRVASAAAIAGAEAAAEKRPWTPGEAPNPGGWNEGRGI